MSLRKETLNRELSINSALWEEGGVASFSLRKDLPASALFTSELKYGVYLYISSHRKFCTTINQIIRDDIFLT